MKLSISNIAWPSNKNLLVYDLMRKYGFTGLEIAPGKVATNLYSINENDRNKFYESIKQFEIAPIAMQSLLFGTSGMNLFEDEFTRNKLLKYLKDAIDWAKYWDIEALVFGSPKNRIMTNPKDNKTWDIAYNFFKTLGDYAYLKKIRFCLEPNPKEYGTNFINTTEEALNFVSKVNSLGLKINLDLGTIILNNELAENIINKHNIHLIGHVHISEPYLGKIVSFNKVTKVKNILHELNYEYWISIEMKESESFNILELNNITKIVSEIVL